ncbi:MAG: CDP-archaeol synthase [Candidatus Buchananbacteria bacterium]|nr:CDP-archaeol synthase [Candidatus Buchananbacteria bacterium]
MIILQVLYFMLPAYCANMAPVFATKIFGQKFNWPLDFGLQIKDKPLLGKNKTWRGLAAGIILGIVIVYLQRYLYNLDWAKDLSLFDYSKINLWLAGFLFGFGVILGDAIKSLIKRRKNLQPGAKWFPWDQMDFLGALVLIHFVYIPDLLVVLIIIIVSPFLPLITNYVGYILNIKKVAW